MALTNLVSAVAGRQLQRVKSDPPGVNPSGHGSAPGGQAGSSGGPGGASVPPVRKHSDQGGRGQRACLRSCGRTAGERRPWRAAAKELRLAEMLGNGPLAWNEQRTTWGSSDDTDLLGEAVDCGICCLAFDSLEGSTTPASAIASGRQWDQIGPNLNPTAASRRRNPGVRGSKQSR
jgi:hypothetical protein